MIQNQKNKALSVTLITGGSVMVAYYDFCMFGLMSSYLVEVFFPRGQDPVTFKAAYLLLLIGYIVRPMGGVLFGVIGDKYGRRFSLVITMSLMAVSTLFIGLLPDYNTFGFLSAILLMVFRLLQGLSFGAELPGDLTVISELKEKNKLPFYYSIVMAANGFGAVFCYFVLYMLSAKLKPEQITDWGWRLPFIFGGIVSLLSLFWQIKMSDPKEFKTIKKKISSKKLLKNLFMPLIKFLYVRPSSVLMGVLLTSFFACLVLLGIYFCNYIPQNYGYEDHEVYLAKTISRIVSTFFLIIMGFVVSKVGSIKIIYISLFSFFFFFLLYIVFDPLQIGNLKSLMSFFCCYELLQSMFIASYIPFIVQLFDNNVRFTGVAICYNFGFTLSSVLPSSFNRLINIYDDPLTVFVIPLSLSILCIASLFFYNNKKQLINLFIENDKYLVK